MGLFVIILSRLVPLLFVASISLVGSRYTYDVVSRTRPRLASWAFAGVSLIGLLACIPFACRGVLIAGGRLALQEHRYQAADILFTDYDAWGGRLTTQMNRTWAFARMQLGDWRGAEEVLREARDPSDPQTRLLLAVCAYYENDPAAESMLMQIPDVRGAQLQVREYLLGRIAQKRGQIAGAYLHYRKAATAAPNFLPAIYQGVRLNLLAGDPAVAQTILDSYTSRFPGAAVEPDVQTLRAAIARRQPPPDKEYQIVSFSLRVEDVLTVLAAVTLIAFAGFRSISRIELTEENYWDFSFILAPVAFMVFAASVRYAFAPRGTSSIQEVSTRTGTILRDWSPFLFFLLFYESFRLGTWLSLSPVDRDDLLLRWDRALFGETPSFLLDPYVNARITSVMSAAYLLHLILPPVVALLWYWRDVKMFRQFLLSVLIGGLIGIVGYAIVPAVGPAVAYPGVYKHSLSGDAFIRVTEIVEAARVPRDVFPSLHVGLSSIVLYYCWRYGRAAFLIALPMVIANWISTIYLRYHYLIDVFGGWATAALAIALAAYLLRLEDAIKQRLRKEKPVFPRALA